MSDYINSATGLPYDCGDKKNWRRKSILRIQAVERPLSLYLASLCCSVARWTNLMKLTGISSNYLETLLFFNGMAVLFKFGSGYVILPCVNETKPDVMGRVVKVRPYPWNNDKLMREKDGLLMTLWVQDEYDENGNLIHKQDAVLIKNNEWCVPTWLYIKPYVDQLKYTMQSKNLHQILSRVKWMVKGDKSSIKGLRAQIERVLSNDEPYVAVDVGLGDDPLTEICGSQDTMYNPEPYWYDIDKTLNFILTHIGLDNHQNIQKKERETIAEVKSNTSSTKSSAWIWESTRTEAVEKIKSVLGFSLEFEWGYSDEPVEDETPVENKEV